MRPCPRCDRIGIIDAIGGGWCTCPLCGGDKYVSHFRAAQYELERIDTQPEMAAVRPPETEKS